MMIGEANLYKYTHQGITEGHFELVTVWFSIKQIHCFLFQNEEIRRAFDLYICLFDADSRQLSITRRQSKTIINARFMSLKIEDKMLHLLVRK